jgi:ribosomal protein S8
MTMTDPIADMLTRLRNANQAYHDSVSMPYSKLKQGVAEILKQEGYSTQRCPRCSAGSASRSSRPARVCSQTVRPTARA